MHLTTISRRRTGVESGPHLASNRERRGLSQSDLILYTHIIASARLSEWYRLPPWRGRCSVVPQAMRQQREIVEPSLATMKARIGATHSLTNKNGIQRSRLQSERVINIVGVKPLMASYRRLRRPSAVAGSLNTSMLQCEKDGDATTYVHVCAQLQREARIREATI
jgi:hypothetical protein